MRTGINEINVPATLVHKMSGKTYRLDGTLVSVNESANTCTMRFGERVAKNVPIEQVYLNEGVLDYIKGVGQKVWGAVKNIIKKIKGFIFPVDENGNAMTQLINMPINVATMNIPSVAFVASDGMRKVMEEQGMNTSNLYDMDTACADGEANDSMEAEEKIKRIMEVYTANEGMTITQACRYVNEKYYKFYGNSKHLNEGEDLDVPNVDVVGFGDVGKYGRTYTTVELKKVLREHFNRYFSNLQLCINNDTDISEPNKKIPLVWGAPGIGKTACIKQALAEIPYKTEIIVVSCQNLTDDSFSLPKITTLPDGITDVTVEVPRTWLPVYARNEADPEYNQMMERYYNSGAFLHNAHGKKEFGGKEARHNYSIDPMMNPSMQVLNREEDDDLAGMGEDNIDVDDVMIDDNDIMVDDNDNMVDVNPSGDGSDDIQVSMNNPDPSPALVQSDPVVNTAVPNVGNVTIKCRKKDPSTPDVEIYKSVIRYLTGSTDEQAIKTEAMMFQQVAKDNDIPWEMFVAVHRYKNAKMGRVSLGMFSNWVSQVDAQCIDDKPNKIKNGSWEGTNAKNYEIMKCYAHMADSFGLEKDWYKRCPDFTRNKQCLVDVLRKQPDALIESVTTITRKHKSLNEVNASAFMDDEPTIGAKSSEGIGGIIFFDEIARANPNIFNHMMSICGDRQYSDMVVAKGWTFVAAANRPVEDDHIGGPELMQFKEYWSSEAKKDRFLSMTFTPTINEWLDWARQKNKKTGRQNVLEVFCKFVETFGAKVWREGFLSMAHADPIKNTDGLDMGGDQASGKGGKMATKLRNNEKITTKEVNTQAPYLDMMNVFTSRDYQMEVSAKFCDDVKLLFLMPVDKDGLGWFDNAKEYQDAVYSSESRIRKTSAVKSDFDRYAERNGLVVGTEEYRDARKTYLKTHKNDVFGTTDLDLSKVARLFSKIGTEQSPMYMAIEELCKSRGLSDAQTAMKLKKCKNHEITTCVQFVANHITDGRTADQYNITDIRMNSMKYMYLMMGDNLKKNLRGDSQRGKSSLIGDLWDDYSSCFIYYPSDVCQSIVNTGEFPAEQGDMDKLVANVYRSMPFKGNNTGKKDVPQHVVKYFDIQGYKEKYDESLNDIYNFLTDNNVTKSLTASDLKALLQRAGVLWDNTTLVEKYKQTFTEVMAESADGVNNGNALKDTVFQPSKSFGELADINNWTDMQKNAPFAFIMMIAMNLSCVKNAGKSYVLTQYSPFEKIIPLCTWLWRMRIQTASEQGIVDFIRTIKDETTMSPKTSDLKKIALINKVLNGGDEGSSKSDTYEFDKHMVYSMTLPLLLLKVVPASKEAILKKLKP